MEDNIVAPSPVDTVAEALQRTSLSVTESNDSARWTCATAEESLKSLSTEDALDLLCPLAVLAVCAFAWQPKSSEISWQNFMPLAEGTSGRVSVGLHPKKQLNPYFSELSGRHSHYPGEMELITLKTPKRPRGVGSGGNNVSSHPDIHFKNMLPELALLSTPQLLYHHNIVDLLGYFWEPTGGSGRQPEPVQYHPTLMLEFADQGSLSTFINYGPPISPADKLGICIDICRALQTLHEELTVVGKPIGLFHGDLKPDNILVFSKPDGGGKGFTAKLCDLGSCTRYPKTDSFLSSRASAGTPGWIAPELNGASEQEVRPSAADAFSLGLLVAFLFLGRDLFRVQNLAKAIFSKWASPAGGSFRPTAIEEVTDASEPTKVAEIRIQLQRMIDNHPEEIRTLIMEAIATLPLSTAVRGAVMSLVEQTLEPAFQHRLADFSVLTEILGGDPHDVRHRTPIQPVVDTFATPGPLTAEWAMTLIHNVATMPEHFHAWLGDHLEEVYQHLVGTAEMDGARCYIATLRGLLAFLPPGVERRTAEGISWLEKAALFGDPNCALLAVRLAAACNVPANNNVICDQLVNRAADEFSMIAREQLGRQSFPGVQDMTPAEQMCYARLLQRFAVHFEHEPESGVGPQHCLAFQTETGQIEQLLTPFVERGLDLEIESSLGISSINGHHLTYSSSQPGTGLHWAVQVNNQPAIRALIQAGASPYGDSKRNAWFVAVEGRLLPVLQLFVDFCPCPDDEARKTWTHEALLSGLPRSYLACGWGYVARTFEMFQYLFSVGALTRTWAYKSTVALGAGEPRLLAKLLDVDYPLNEDEALLREVLLDAIMTGDADAVRLVLPILPRLQSTESFSMHALAMSASQPGQRSLEIFESLLGHLHDNFDLDASFSFLGGPGNDRTLLCRAFWHGNVDHAITLLRLGADPSIGSSASPERPGIKVMSAFSHLLLPQTHNHYLALCRFLRSDFIQHGNPFFVLDNAFADRDRRFTILHLLCGDEHSRLHSSPHRSAFLVELLRHLKGMIRTPRRDDVVNLVNRQMLEQGEEAMMRTSRRDDVVNLVNQQMLEQGEEAMTALQLAADSGFRDAIPALVEAGADPMLRVAGDSESPGVTALHLADQRDGSVWDKQWGIQERVRRAHGTPWFGRETPVARQLRAEFVARTRPTVRELERVLRGNSEGREMLARRAQFFESQS